MAPTQTTKAVIRVYSGPWTGDTVVITDDGRRWVSRASFVSDTATGETRALLSADRTTIRVLP